MIFRDRKDAGERLAEELHKFKNKTTLVYGLAKGGVPVAFEAAKQNNFDLSVLVVRKLGFPELPDIGFGAIASNNINLLDKNLIDYMGLSKEDMKKIINNEKIELKKNIQAFRNGQSIPNLESKTVIIIDDGVSTGLTATTAIKLIKEHNPKKLIFATPVGPYKVLQFLENYVDEVICLSSPVEFNSVDEWYQDFPDVTDDEVIKILQNLV